MTGNEREIERFAVLVTVGTKTDAHSLRSQAKLHVSIVMLRPAPATTGRAIVVG